MYKQIQKNIKYLGGMVMNKNIFTKKSFKLIWEYFKTGILIGITIELIFSFFEPNALIGVDSFVKQFQYIAYAKLIEYLFYGGFGIVSALLSGLHHKLPLFLASLIHLIILYIYFIITGSCLHWLSFGFISILVSSLIFVFIFIVIWTIFYFIAKRDIHNINLDLTKNNK